MKKFLNIAIDGPAGAGKSTIAKAVAKELGRDVLSGVSEEELVARIPMLRECVGDRAILRAIHFIREKLE